MIHNSHKDTTVFCW